MPSSALAPAISSSAISRSAAIRLRLAIQDNAVIKRVSKHAAGIQMGFSPCINRAWNDVASKSASRDGPIDLIVIQYSLAHDKKIARGCSPSTRHLTASASLGS